MRREDCVEMFQKVPERFHAQMNVVMRNQSVLAVDAVVRFEPTYLVLRGREGGTTDEGRAFFVPYEEVAYLRLERLVKISELKKMFGETGFVDHEDKIGQQLEAEETARADAAAKTYIDSQTPAPAAAPTDPASIAKKNLLDRIRAARANAGGVTGKLGGK